MFTDYDWCRLRNSSVSILGGEHALVFRLHFLLEGLSRLFSSCRIRLAPFAVST